VAKRRVNTNVLLSFSADINMPEIGGTPEWSDHINKLELLRGSIKRLEVNANRVDLSGLGYLQVSNIIGARPGMCVYYYDNGAVFGIASADSTAATHIVVSSSGGTAFLTAFSNDCQLLVTSGDGENVSRRFWLYLDGLVTDDISKIVDSNGVAQNGCIYQQSIGARLSRVDSGGRSRSTVIVAEPIQIG